MKKARLVLFILPLAFMLTGCFRAKEYIYFQNLKATSDTTGEQRSDTGEQAQTSIVIQPFDQLDIRIKASQKAFESITESGSSGSAIAGGTGNYSQNTYLSGYQVDPLGFVTIPGLGNVNLKGLTILQAKDKIRKLMHKFDTDPFVDIKFLTFRVIMLGELNRPGTTIVPNEKANLIDVISLAGDLTDGANRKEIKIIRGDPRNNPKVYVIDMTNSKSFNSPGFTLQPNDIVYAQPLGRKFFFANFSEVATFLTILNTLFVLTELYISLSNLNKTH